MAVLRIHLKDGRVIHHHTLRTEGDLADLVWGIHNYGISRDVEGRLDFIDRSQIAKVETLRDSPIGA